MARRSQVRIVLLHPNLDVLTHAADVTEIPPTVVVGIADNAPQAPADAASVLSVALPMVATIGALVAALL